MEQKLDAGQLQFPERSDSAFGRSTRSPRRPSCAEAYDMRAWQEEQPAVRNIQPVVRRARDQLEDPLQPRVDPQLLTG
jgi:hypothetical protein